MNDLSNTQHQQMVKSRGMRFPLDKSIMPPRVRASLRNDGYEKKEADAILKLVKMGDVVMELGGGIGFMSTLVATQTRAKSVHAFEANPKLVPFIREVHGLNNAKKAEVTHGVLGAEDGEQSFYVRPNFLASSLSPMEDDGDDVTEERVPSLDVNRVIAELKPSVLICDIEGAEVDLLPQMDLSNFRAVVIETHPQWIGKEGIRKVFRTLDDAGLVFFPRWSHGKVAVFRSDW